ncbi:hypothetical protein P67b_00007 [Ruegeria phage Tedan]|nr:hypothetical protein P67b_00007 [Ruegeria phage Tedan]
MSKHGSPASTSLREYGQAQRLLMILNFVTGTAIWAVAGLLRSPLADPHTYGQIISAIHAEWWAAPLSIGAAMHLLGQVANGDPRLPAYLSPLWRFIGAWLCFLVMTAFVVGGLHAPPKLFTVVHYIQSTFVGLLCLWCIVMGWQDLRAGIKMTRKKAT